MESLPENAPQLSAENEKPADNPEHLGRCTGCDFSVRFRALGSTGFMLVGSDASLGIGEHGRPMCPNGHGELEIADDKMPAAEAITQTADKLAAAKQLPLIDTTPVFNTDGAYLELERMACEADRLQRIWKDDAEQAKQSKEAYDTAAKLYVSAGLEFHRRRLAKIDAAESRSETPDVAADPADYAELWDTVKAAGQILLPGTIEAWTDEQRAEVAGWTTDQERERPAVLGRAHIGADILTSEARPGDTFQSCTVCGARLASYPTGSGDTSAIYPSGALVGTDCPGPDVAHHYPPKTRKKRTRAQASPAIDEATEPAPEPDDPVAQPDQAPAGDEAEA